MQTKHTAGTWRIKETFSKEYPSHIDYSIHGDEQELHTIPTDENSPLWKFHPHIADVRFGRSNEEREANATLISFAPEMNQMVYDLMKCIKRLTEDEQPDKTLEAYWIGEAHELLLKVNGGAYWKNANEKTTTL